MVNTRAIFIEISFSIHTRYVAYLTCPTFSDR
jgi:hypothetical protein